jgi:predicted RNA-binding protein YlxR (DUF448 family)
VLRNHIPIRTCIGCGLKGNKREFIRLVKTGSGSVSIDIEEFLPGRGVYLCRTLECSGKAFKANRLERSLRTQIGGTDRIRIKEQLGESLLGVGSLEEKLG